MKKASDQRRANTSSQKRRNLKCFWIAAQVLLISLIISDSASRGNDKRNDANRDTSQAPSSLPMAIEQKCVKCHNQATRKGELDLSSMEGLMLGGESGESLIEENLADARLWQVIEDDEMPPEGEVDLTSNEVQQIKDWLVAQRNTSMHHQDTIAPNSIHDVLPVLLLRCASCHGGQRQDGGFDVRTYSSISSGGRSGPAFISGAPQGSLMVQRVESQQCPPSDLLLKFFVKRPSDSELEKIKQWITVGAPMGNVVEDVADGTPDSLVTQQDREHWAFTPPSRPSGGNSVDDFIGQTLHEHGLDFSPLADRDTLIRRVYLDLTGLPPSVQDWQKWKANSDPDWYSNMVDHLLDTPDYGERWGRYWLDLAGYADSEGGISSDPLRPVAWKYRDYVVRSFNQDKPYNQFLLEQIAGDELTDHTKTNNPTEQQVDQLVATGFLRMGIDETGSRTMNFIPERLKVIDDALSVVGSGLMGLTMECARCHSHKYDPIPQRDYYRLKAIFQGAFDEHNWKSFKQRKFNFGTKAQRQAISKINPPLEKTKKEIVAKLRQKNDALVIETLITKYPEQSEADQQATLAAVRIADNQRTLPQRKLVEQLQLAQVSEEASNSPKVGQIKNTIDQLQTELESIEKAMAPPLSIRALWDEGDPSPTYILRRGEHTQFGRVVGPGVPSVLTDGQTVFEYAAPFPDGTTKTGRRLAFAKWLTSSKHPTTTRVLVNRVWHHHFGKGLVATLENFGIMGARPTHPELLDWLAVEFVSNQWSIKELHRQILNSKTYQQTSRVSESAIERDPDNRFYSRMPLRRMDAETLRDSLLWVSGRLDRERGGIPDPVEVDPSGEVRIKPTPAGLWRRSLYAQYRRTEIPTLLDTFDYPQMGPNCFERSVSTVSPQALLLLNNRQIRDLAKHLAIRLQNMTQVTVTPLTKSASAPELSGQTEQNRDWTRVIELAYQVVLSRSPSSKELELGSSSISELMRQWNGNKQKALESYCHVLLNSASFLYID